MPKSIEKSSFTPPENQKFQLIAAIAPAHRTLSHLPPQKILALTEIPYVM